MRMIAPIGLSLFHKSLDICHQGDGCDSVSKCECHVQMPGKGTGRFEINALTQELLCQQYPVDFANRSVKGRWNLRANTVRVLGDGQQRLSLV